MASDPDLCELVRDLPAQVPADAGLETVARANVMAGIMLLPDQELADALMAVLLTLVEEPFG